MSLVIPQIYLAPNWRLRDHDWMRRKQIMWVLKYTDKVAPKVEELDSDEDSDSLQGTDYPDATILSFDHLVNEETNLLPNTVAQLLLNHLPQAIGFILMAKNVMKDDPDKGLVICSPRGRSRCAAVLAAALILTQKAPAQAAVGHVMAQHTRTNISQQLLLQLGVFENTMNNQEQKLGFYRLMTKHVEAYETRVKNQIKPVDEKDQSDIKNS